MTFIGDGIRTLSELWNHQRKQRARHVLRDEYAEMRRVNNALLDAHNYALTPSQLLDNLGELDDRLIDLLIDMRRYEQVIGRGAGEPSEIDRLRAVDLARWMVRTDVLTDVATDMWTDFGFGQVVNIVPVDPIAALVWDECWIAPRNRPLFAQDKLHELFSDKVLTDGEVFFVAWASGVDGTTTWRQYTTDQVKDIIASPQDGALNLWYIIEAQDGKQLAFPDAFAYFSFPNAFEDLGILPRGVQYINATDIARDNGTFACIVAAQRNVRNKRGWPQFSLAFPWSDGYKQMLQDHASVARLVATYVDKITMRSGQRAIDALRNSLQSSLVNNDDFWDSNPAPAAGSTWIQNEQLDRQRMPLATGALDSQRDTLVMLAQTSTAYKIPAFYLGRGDMMQNKAVADAATRPAIESWRRYQVFWAARFTDIVETTLRLKNKFSKTGITDFSVNVSMAAPMDIETGDLVNAMKAITESSVNMALDMDIATRANTVLVKMLLDDFGVNDTEAVLEPEEEQPQATEKAAPLLSILEQARENFDNGMVSEADYLEFLAMELSELVK